MLRSARPERRLSRGLARAPRAGLRGVLARSFFALCVALAVAGCSKPGGWVILEPQRADLDYDVALGRIAYGDTREHVVRMRNAEGRPVAISRISAGCSCTTARIAYIAASGARVDGPVLWTDTPFVVPDGAVLEILLRVESTTSPNPNAAKRVLVRLHSDSEVDPAKTLEVHYVVDMPFYVVPRTIELGRVPVGGIAQGKTDITGATGGGERIVGVLEKPDVLDVVLETPEQTGSSLWRLHVRWFPPLRAGPQLRSVVLETTGPGGQGVGRPLEVQVHAIGVDDVVAEPMLFSVPAKLEAGGGAGAVTLRSLVGGNRLRVTGARAEGPFAESFRVAATPVEPDAQGRSENWMVQLTCLEPPRAPGAFGGTVIVTLDDPVTPEVRIPYLRKSAP